MPIAALNIEPLRRCIEQARRGRSISYASTTLFFFEYLLTLRDEVDHAWLKKRALLGAVPFYISRYCAMAASILVLLPSATSTKTDQAATALRIISITSSEFVFAVRAWAIWGKNRRILYTLAALSVSTFTLAATVTVIGIATRRDISTLPPEYGDLPDCRVMISDIKDGYIAVYVVLIVYEACILCLTLIKITVWRREILQNIRAPLIDTLWRDGILYFIFMLILNFINIGLIANGSTTLLQGGSQLQMVFHSAISNRIVLHLASSRQPREISTLGSSVYTSDIRIPRWTLGNATSGRA
ncbi:hypothetical protein L218DRAFT_961031 [Marasmius fiardii PR-910]|nr:hypothetical protein L218DRAFT_961031 [Marasmius fiardii PR-910]